MNLHPRELRHPANASEREVTVTIVTALKMAQALGVTLADLFSELERRRGRSE